MINIEEAVTHSLKELNDKGQHDLAESVLDNGWYVTCFNMEHDHPANLYVMIDTTRGIDYNNAKDYYDYTIKMINQFTSIPTWYEC